MSTKAIASAALLSASLTAGCASPPTTTSPTPTTSTTTTEVFVGSLALKDSSFYSFTVVQKSNVFLTFASMTVASPGPAVSIPVTLGLGVPAGIGCGLTQSVTVSPALTPQIAVTLDPGIFCVSIQDVGNLTAQVSFAIRIVHQ
jgi:hypothetical protein